MPRTYEPGTYGREESKAVKDALLKAGFPVLRVGHARGTARGWLEIWMEKATPEQWRDGTENKAIAIAQLVTGRRGEYDGRIVVYRQG
jgi:hypothetical protein